MGIKYFIGAVLLLCMGSCSTGRLKLSCLNLPKEETKMISSQIVNQIDSITSKSSMYCMETIRPLKANCVDSDRIEIITLNECKDTVIFYFDSAYSYKKHITILKPLH